MVGAWGRRQENNPENCFPPTETEILRRRTDTVKFPVTEAELLNECETYGARTNPQVRTHIAKKTTFRLHEKPFLLW